MNASTYLTLDQLSSDAADRRQLIALLDQTIDAVPEDSAPAALVPITSVLVGETLGQCARKGLLPVSAHAGTLIACREALRRLPEAASVPEFRTAAKAALRAAL